MRDITLSVDASGWCFRPRGCKADNFLFSRFANIGERDLTEEDVETICREAEERGFTIDDRR